MNERTTLAVIFGGRSTEHEVSVTSARSIMAQADGNRFDVVPFGITSGGAWLTPEESRRRLDRVEAGETRGIGDDEGAGGRRQLALASAAAVELGCVDTRQPDPGLDVLTDPDARAHRDGVAVDVDRPAEQVGGCGFNGGEFLLLGPSGARAREDVG